MRIGSIVVRCYEFATKCWPSGRKRFITFPESQRKADGSFFEILRAQDPTKSLDKFPEKRSGKRSRLHLDLYTKSSEAEVERLIKIGATRYPWRYRPGDDFVVLEDPDGNLFCVVQVAET